MGKAIFTILIGLLSFGFNHRAMADSNKGLIGLTVIKDDAIPFQYDLSKFLTNEIENTELSNHAHCQSTTAFLNELNIGKNIVNKLLGYNLDEGMTLDILTQRIPTERQQQPTYFDYVTALANNYVLVINLNDESKKHLQQGNTVKFIPQGECHLYQIDITPENSEAIRNCLFSAKDSEIVRGEKRFYYDGISILLKLVNSNSDITPKGVKMLLDSIPYLSFEDVQENFKSNDKSELSKAIKIVLSPILIIK